MAEFADSLSTPELLVVTGIYAAREEPIAGVRAQDIVVKAAQINSVQRSIFVPDRHDVPNILMAMVQAGDLVLFMGAGDIREQAEAFTAKLKMRDGA